MSEIVFVIGGPGSGKGTQCSKIAEKLGYVHLSIGDLLREATAGEASSPEAALIKDFMAKGALVPIGPVMKLLKAAIGKHAAAGKSKFLLDGFPRNRENIEGWNAEFGADKTVRVKLVLVFDCPEDVMEKRLIERGKTSGRVDDNIEAIKKRFKTFVAETAPVIEEYRKLGIVRTIDATRSVDEVFASVTAVFAAAADDEKIASSTTPEAVFVIGGPGAGKGTQCAKISSTFGYVHLSTGDLLREAAAGDSDEAKLIQKIQAEGKLVGIDIVMSVLKKAIFKFTASGKSKFLIDGFPRSQENIDGWNKAFSDGSVKLKFVLFFNCPEDVMEKRLLERGKTSGRSDDNAEAILKRFKTYMESTMPIILHYKKQGLLREISAVPPPDEVFAEVSKLFQIPQVVFVLGGPGAGKGTQCAKLVKDYGFVHLSAGDLLRDEQKSGSEHGDLIATYIKEGKIVPVAITVQLIRKAIFENLGKGKKLFLVDGFPRNLENLEGWNKFVGSEAIVRFCLFIDVEESIMEARLLERGKTSGRSDDNIESIKKRFKTFVESTVPIAKYFESIGKLRKVSGADSVDVVYENIRKLLKDIDTSP